MLNLKKIIKLNNNIIMYIKNKKSKTMTREKICG